MTDEENSAPRVGPKITIGKEAAEQLARIGREQAEWGKKLSEAVKFPKLPDLSGLTKSVNTSQLPKLDPAASLERESRMAQALYPADFKMPPHPALRAGAQTVDAIGEVVGVLTMMSDNAIAAAEVERSERAKREKGEGRRFWAVAVPGLLAAGIAAVFGVMAYYRDEPTPQPPPAAEVTVAPTTTSPVAPTTTL